MITPQPQWKLFFIEKAGGNKSQVELKKETFENLFEKHPNVDGELVFERITSLLSEPTERRRKYPIVGRRYPFPRYRKCRIGDIRIFFRINERKRTLEFNAEYRRDLKLKNMRGVK